MKKEMVSLIPVLTLETPSNQFLEAYVELAVTC